jgi:hypothetical protein
MPTFRHRLALVALAAPLAATCALAAAAAPGPDTPLTAADRKEVVDTLAAKLRARYVFPDRAAQIAAQLQAHAAHGDFESAKTTQAFVEALDRDLRAVGDDRHFRVELDPGFDAAQEADDHVPTREELAQGRAEAAQQGFGIARVQRLPGNVGYLDLRAFAPIEFIGAAYDNALALLAGTDALVVDLRSNGGGEPRSVAYFASHFFAEGDERHLNDIYDRPSDRTREYWTVPVTGPRYMKPLVLLTSPRTASGAEECANDLQSQKRATLVGETTLGAANPGGPVALGHGLVAFVPSGRPSNAVTHTGWEKVGIRPDVAVPAADAMKTAYLSLLDRRLAEASDPREKESLQDVRQRAVDGKIELPGWAPRR